MVAQYNAEELLSKRGKVSAQIRSELVKRADKFHLLLDDVSITHLTFYMDIFFQLYFFTLLYRRFYYVE